jgi:hypothetical protein
LSADMFDESGLPDDQEERMRVEAFRGQAEMLMQRAEKIPEKAKNLGLYAEGAPQITQVPTPFGPRPALVMQFTMGRIALRPRTQDPESEKMDDEFRNIEIAAVDDDFLDERERIRQALAEGRDPYEEDDDDIEP